MTEQCIKKLALETAIAAANILKEKYNIDWKRIIGMRNVIVHNYEGIIQDTLYETLVEDIPLLLEELLK